MLRKLHNDDRPCLECDKEDTCEDPQAAPRTIMADVKEQGCIEFINYLKSPLNKGKRTI